MPVGKAMYYASKDRHDPHPPIPSHIHDTRHMKMVKELVRAMMSFKPDDRPTTGEVLEELMAISGEA